MISFEKKDGILILVYSPENPGLWLIEKFRNEGFPLSRTFHLTKNHLIKSLNKEFIEVLNKKPKKEDQYWAENLYFNFGVLEGEYYKINKSILEIANKLYIHKKIELKRKLFVAEYNISVFSHIDSLINEPIYIGGANEHSIPYKDFQSLLSGFPNSLERQKYSLARVSSILAPYFDRRKDAIEKYEKYMNKKRSIQGEGLLSNFKNYEKGKYKIILKKLQDMLKEENLYNEYQWQKEIIEILQLLFPKYIKAFDKVKIKDCYENTKRELDFLLVDTEGHIDIAEIKRPLGCQVISKNTYRGNHCPVRELSGAVMQVEKYLLHLNKWGTSGENHLNKRYEGKLPQDLRIKIVNPGAMIILGRDNNLSKEQKKDFEIVKRKYKNIIDIITYDDLIKRLEFTISQYESGEHN